MFNVTLSFDFSQERYIYKQPIEPFLLPPTGTSTIADFKILAHVNLKTPNKSKSVKVVDE